MSKSFSHLAWKLTDELRYRWDWVIRKIMESQWTKMNWVFLETEGMWFSQIYWWSKKLDWFLQDAVTRKIIILMPDVHMPWDLLQYFPESILKGGAWIIALTAKKYRENMMHILGNAGVIGYVGHTGKTLKKKFFPNTEVKIILVRNSMKDDLRKIIQWWWPNTILVISGHGSASSVLMSDGSMTNNDFGRVPDEKLKAIIQHTCGWERDSQSFGQWFGEKVFGYDNGTNPIDFLVNPLPEIETGK